MGGNVRGGPVARYAVVLDGRRTTLRDHRWQDEREQQPDMLELRFHQLEAGGSPRVAGQRTAASACGYERVQWVATQASSWGDGPWFRRARPSRIAQLMCGGEGPPLSHFSIKITSCVIAASQHVYTFYAGRFSADRDFFFNFWERLDSIFASMRRGARADKSASSSSCPSTVRSPSNQPHRTL